MATLSRRKEQVAPPVVVKVEVVRKSPAAAPSILALRNRIVIATNKASRLVNRFRKKHIENADDDLLEVYEEFLKPILQRMSSKEDLKDWKDMNVAVITRFKDDSNVCRRQDFKSLVAVCQRADALVTLLKEVRPVLEIAYAYADKFLGSLSQEAGGHRFRCIDEYENKLNELRRTITSNFESIQRLAGELEAIRPVSRYLNEYSKVIHYMSEISERAAECAVALRDWAVADENYVTNGEREVKQLLRESSTLHQAIGEGTASYDVQYGYSRKTGDLRRSRLELLAERKRLASLCERAEAINEEMGIDSTALTLQRRQFEKGDEIATRWSSAPPEGGKRLQFTKPSQRRGVFKDSIGSLESEKRTVQEAIDFARHAVNFRQEELNKSQLSADRFEERLSVQTKSVKDAVKTIHVAESMAFSLKNLMTLKKSSMTLKKIENSVFTIDGGALEESIRQAAALVGPQWPNLYRQLTFTPRRSAQRVDEDIATISRIGERWGHTVDEMARKVLQKWARKSCTASTNELDFAAKRIARSTRPSVKRSASLL